MHFHHSLLYHINTSKCFEVKKGDLKKQNWGQQNAYKLEMKPPCLYATISLVCDFVCCFSFIANGKG